MSGFFLANDAIVMILGIQIFIMVAFDLFDKKKAANVLYECQRDYTSASCVVQQGCMGDAKFHAKLPKDHQALINFYRQLRTYIQEQ